VITLAGGTFLNAAIVAAHVLERGARANNALTHLLTRDGLAGNCIGLGRGGGGWMG
jgi:hypothetical protein